MRPPGRFLNSPLARHPFLLARKVASRIGIRSAGAVVPPQRMQSVQYPSHWASLLRGWCRQIPLQPGPHQFNQVFGHEFDEGLLLTLCREGTPKGELGLVSDVKLPWEYSRGQPLVTNALSGGEEHAAHCCKFIEQWIAANSDTNGLNWSCAMEVAIRAINWTFADCLFDGSLSRHLGPDRWAALIWTHGQIVWSRLEAQLVSSNHYLADLLGLLVIGSVFPTDHSAQRWHHFAVSEFPRALLAQTYPDGGLYEASLRYHAYVTEMALLFRLAQGGPFPVDAESRLIDMCQIVADFGDSTGDVFPIGDDDSGRVLALDFASMVGRRKVLLSLAALLLQRTPAPSHQAVYRQTGWCVRTIGDFRLALDFGGVGLSGLGSHAHNDDFSFCLDWKGQPLVVDPGTFLYTGDVDARNRFRSTLSHNTVAIDSREQRPIDSALFLLRGKTSSYPHVVEGEHWAFTRNAGSGVQHRRIIAPDGGAVVIHDLIKGSARHRLEWRFTLHPHVRAAKIATGFELTLSEQGTVRVEAGGASPELEISKTDYSPAYGRRLSTSCCIARIHASECEVRWRIAPTRSVH